MIVNYYIEIPVGRTREDLERLLRLGEFDHGFRFYDATACDPLARIFPSLEQIAAEKEMIAKGMAL